MTANHNEESPRRAVEHLEGLGLSTYAARTFVGLVTLDRAGPFALWSADEPNTLLVLLRAVLGLPE